MKLSTAYATIGLVAFLIATLLPSTHGLSNHTILSACANHTKLLEEELSKIFDEDDDSNTDQQNRALVKTKVVWNWNGIGEKMMFWLKEQKPACYRYCTIMKLNPWICTETVPQCKMPQYWGVSVPPFEIVPLKRHLRKWWNNDYNNKKSPDGPKSSNESKEGNHDNGKPVDPRETKCENVKKAVRVKLQKLSEIGNDGLKGCAKGLLKSELLDCANGIIDFLD